VGGAGSSSHDSHLLLNNRIIQGFPGLECLHGQ
jgi:hypothetical protein